MNEGASGGLGKKNTKDTSQDRYGGEAAKMKPLQVGGRAVCGQLSHLYSMYEGVKLLRTQSQSGEQRPSK